MEQNLYELLNNLIKLAILLVGLISARNKLKRKRKPDASQNSAKKVKDARKDIAA